MTRQPSARPSKEAARSAAKEAQEIADSVLEMSAASVVTRSKAAVLQLEAKGLREALEKKQARNLADKSRAQKLLLEATDLRDRHLAKTAKKNVQLVEQGPKGSPRPQGEEAGSPGSHDEALDDEESLLLLRSATTCPPVTAPAVDRPDADIVAMVSRKAGEKALWSSSGKIDSLSTETATLPGTAEKTTAEASKLVLKSPTPAPSHNLSPAAKNMPKPTKAASPASSKWANLLLPKQKAEKVPKMEVRAPPATAPPDGHFPAATTPPGSRPPAATAPSGSRSPRKTFSMQQEEAELHNVIRGILDSAHQQPAQQCPPQQADDPTATSPFSGSGLKRLARVGCALVLVVLIIVLLLAALTLTDRGAVIRKQEVNYTYPSDLQERHHESGDAFGSAPAPTSNGTNGAGKATMEGRYYYDKIFDALQ